MWQRLAWLARIHSSDAEAMSDEVANEHLFDRLNDFGMAHFVNTFRPLVKLHEVGELLLLLYLVLHVGSVVLHSLLGSPIWQRMWKFGGDA